MFHWNNSKCFCFQIIFNKYQKQHIHYFFIGFDFFSTFISENIRGSEILHFRNNNSNNDFKFKSLSCSISLRWNRCTTLHYILQIWLTPRMSITKQVSFLSYFSFSAIHKHECYALLHNSSCEQGCLSKQYAIYSVNLRVLKKKPWRFLTTMSFLAIYPKAMIIIQKVERLLKDHQTFSNIITKVMHFFNEFWFLEKCFFFGLPKIQKSNTISNAIKMQKNVYITLSNRKI